MRVKKRTFHFPPLFRCLSGFLAAVMLVSLLPSAVFAAEPCGTLYRVAPETSEETQLNENDPVSVDEALVWKTGVTIDETNGNTVAFPEGLAATGKATLS